MDNHFKMMANDCKISWNSSNNAKAQLVFTETNSDERCSKRDDQVVDFEPGLGREQIDLEKM